MLNSFRTTWAILPWSIVVLCWIRIAFIVKSLKTPEQPEGISLDAAATPSSLQAYSFAGSVDIAGSINNKSSEPEEPDSYKLQMKDKGLLSFLWISGVINSHLNDVVIGKGKEMLCSIEDDFTEKLNIASIVIMIVLPFCCGPLVLLFAQLWFSICKCRRPSDSPQIEYKVDQVPSCGILTFLSLVYLLAYFTNMIISETSEIKSDMFMFIMLKYLLGTSYQFLSPVVILIFRRDIWDTAVYLYKKGGTTQSKSIELTYEQIQRELGLGVGA